MTTIIKPKRSNSAGSAPSQSDLAIREIAVNAVDKIIYMRNGAGTVVGVANFTGESTNFPDGDYGDFSTAANDAFGQAVQGTYDCRDTPSGALSTENFGGIT